MSARVLIVEDEALLAIDLASNLTDAGFFVVGPATSVAKALRLIEKTGCDVAVLDVNLRDETSEPVARELRARSTPFLFLSGISKERLPNWFDGLVVLSKPAQTDVVVGALQECLAASRTR